MKQLLKNHEDFILLETDQMCAMKFAFPKLIGRCSYKNIAEETTEEVPSNRASRRRLLSLKPV